MEMPASYALTMSCLIFFTASLYLCYSLYFFSKYGVACCALIKIFNIIRLRTVMFFWSKNSTFIWILKTDFRYTGLLLIIAEGNSRKSKILFNISHLPNIFHHFSMLKISYAKYFPLFIISYYQSFSIAHHCPTFPVAHHFPFPIISHCLKLRQKTTPDTLQLNI